MPSPIHITGVPEIDWILFAITVFVLLYWLRALRLAREGARLLLRNLLKAITAFCFLLVVYTANRERVTLQPAEAQFVAGFIAFFMFLGWQDMKRSRYIPRATRRKVIQRDLKAEKYDPAKHHIDHIWPHKRGGSNTEDNLRVIAKEQNLKKGASRPKFKEMF